MKNISIQYRHNLSLAQKKRWNKFHIENTEFGRKIIQFTKSDEYIKIWHVSTLKKENFNIGNIYSVCNNKRKTADGFKWEFKDNYYS